MEVVAGGGEDGVAAVAVATLEVIAAHAVLGLEVADHRLDGGAAFHLAFDDGGDPAGLTGDPDPELLRVIVTAVALVDVDAAGFHAGHLLQILDHRSEGVAVEGIAVQRLGVKHELAALWHRHRCCDRHLAAKLVGGSRLALADAFDLRRVQGIDLLAAPAMVLVADLDRQIEEWGEARREFGMALDLAMDVADHPAEPGAQEPQRLAGALVLMGMAVAPDHDGGALGDPEITLPQPDALSPGKRDQLDQRPMRQPGIGGVGDRFRLHRRIHRHPLEVPGRDGAGLVGHRQALLDQSNQLVFTKPLAPTSQRAALEGQLVAEAQLAAEVLVVGVLHPARAQHLVGEVLGMLEDEEAGHQPRRQTRLAGASRAHRGEAAIEKLPVDLVGKPHQRVLQVDDLIQRRPQQVPLAIVSRSCHPPPRIRTTRRRGIESQIAKNRNPKTQESGPHRPAFLQNPTLHHADLAN